MLIFVFYTNFLLYLQGIYHNHILRKRYSVLLKHYSRKPFRRL